MSNQPVCFGLFSRALRAGKRRCKLLNVGRLNSAQDRAVSLKNFLSSRRFTKVESKICEQDALIWRFQKTAGNQQEHRALFFALFLVGSILCPTVRGVVPHFLRACEPNSSRNPIGRTRCRQCYSHGARPRRAKRTISGVQRFLVQLNRDFEFTTPLASFVAAHDWYLVHPTPSHTVRGVT